MLAFAYRRARGGARRPALALALAITYFALARLGLLTTSPGVHVPAVWPAGGFLIGVLLVARRRDWPLFVLAAGAGGVAAQLAAGRGIGVACGLGAVDCVAAALAALAVARVSGDRFRLDALPSVLVLAFAGFTAAAVTAVPGAGIAGPGLGGPYWSTMLLLWLTQGVGILVVAPAVLLIASAGRPEVRALIARVPELGLMLAGLAVVALVVFTRPLGASRGVLDFVFPVFPFMLWCALRFGSRGAPFANLVLWTIAGAGTASDRGPFTSPAVGQATHLLQVESFLALAAFGLLVAGARADELRERERSLAASNRRLRREGQLLRKAEAQFRGLLEAAPDAIVIVDHAGVIAIVNAQAEQLFGYPRGELLGETLELLVPERHRRVHARLRDKFLMDPVTRPMGGGLDLHVVRKDGSELPVEIRLAALETEAGVLVSAAVRDVTERKRLVAQVEQRGRLMDLVHEAIIVREPAGSRISYWNREAEEIYGHSAAEAVGEVAHLLLSTEFPASREAVDRELLARGRWEGELWHLCKDDRRILVSSRQALQRDVHGHPIAVIELNSDITEQRRVEGSHRRLAAMVEHSEDAILGMTCAGSITEWNRGAERLYGYSAAEAVGRDVWMLTPPELIANEREMLARVFRGEALEQYETVRLRSDGGRVYVSLTVSPVRARDHAVVAASSIARDITERKRFEGQLQHLADHDHLTGLFNRRRFDEELKREIARAHRYRTSGSVLAIDIDHFKYVNDSLGHPAGDALIAVVAETFRARLRETDVIARIGGDEFAVILPGVDEDGALLVAAELLSALRRESRAELPRTVRHITASIGVAAFAQIDLTSEEVLVEADIAMYDAKEAGRDRVSVYSSAEGREGRMKARLTWADRIRRALEEDGFVLHAQPILSLTGDLASRHELLLRMVGESGELIPPGVFLYIAERMDLIQEIDRWVLRQASRLLAREQRAGHNVVLEVNVSAKSIGDPNLPDTIAQELEAAGADGSGLCLEITETAAIVNIERAKRFAARVAELGCEVALDDFGAGFASFYYLKHLPFDYLKIDGEFIQGICDSRTDQLVVKSLVEIAHGLGKRTIAEFVADGETLELLRGYRIDYVQGFYVADSKPLAAVDLARPGGEGV
jgi:diguanylate cyclase (GGDEF)-like protein/PAS domain S-box-containing protein